MRYCDQCGTPLPSPTPDACPKCGAALTGPAPVPVSPPITTPAPAAPSTTAPAPRWSGRPAGWGSPWRWMFAAASDNGRGTFAALLCAWAGVPMAVMLGVIGLVTGAIAGFFSGTPMGDDVKDRLWLVYDLVLPLPVDVPDLIPDMAWQLGMMLGLIIGAVYGAAALAWLGLTGTWRLLWEGDPMWPVSMAFGNLAAALLLGFLYMVCMTLTERWRLGLMGAREPSGREAAVLRPLVAEAARRLEVPAVPIVLVTDDDAAEVRAHARHLVVTRGLLAETVNDADTLLALLGREMVHWRHGHPLTRAWVRGVALPLALVYDLAAWLFAPTTNTRARPLMFIFHILLWPVTVTVQYIMVPLQAAWWRRVTLEADATAARCGWGAAVAEHIAVPPSRRRGVVATWARVFDTPPQTEARLQQLENLGVSRRDLAADLTARRRLVQRDDAPREGVRSDAE